MCLLLPREMLPKYASSLRSPSYCPTVCVKHVFFFFNKFMAFIVVSLRNCEVPAVVSI